MELIVKGGALDILKWVGSLRGPSSVAHIKNYFNSLDANRVVNGLKLLIDEGYFTIENDEIQVTSKGRIYLEEYNQYGLPEIIKDYSSKVLQFLYEIDEPMLLRSFPDSIIDNAESTSVDKEHNLVDFFYSDRSIKSFVNSSHQYYEINNAGKIFYKMVENERLEAKKKAAAELEKEALGLKKLRGDVEILGQKIASYDKEMQKFDTDFTNARRIEKDYPKVTSRSKWSIRISILTLALLMIIQLLRWKHILP